MATPTLAQILATLKSGLGLTDDQAAGIAGNLVVESGLKPTAYNKNEGAVGYAQWENGRKANLDAYAAKNGTADTDGTTQLGFLISELQGPEHAALVRLQQTTSASSAAAVFDQYYERSSGSTRQQRVTAANTIAAGKDPTASGGGGLIGTAAGLIPPGLLGAPAAVADAVTSPIEAVTNLFGGWQDGLTGIGLKVLAGTAASALVIAGAWTAVHNNEGAAA